MTTNGRISATTDSAPQAAEQRRHARKTVPLDVSFVLGDGSVIVGEVENISAGGALIKSAAEVEIGDQLIVRIPRIGHFAAEVTRLDDEDVAVRFKIRRERAARIADKLICLVNDSDAEVEKRLAVRAAGRFMTDLTFPDGQVTPCEVIDFSTGGAAIAVTPMPRIGTKVRLGKTPARVIRAEDGVVGLSFAADDDQQRD